MEANETRQGYNAKGREKSVRAVIRACRPVICERAGLLIVTKTPPRFYTRVHKARCTTFHAPLIYQCYALSVAEFISLVARPAEKEDEA